MIGIFMLGSYGRVLLVGGLLAVGTSCGGSVSPSEAASTSEQVSVAIVSSGTAGPVGGSRVRMEIGEAKAEGLSDGDGVVAFEMPVDPAVIQARVWVDSAPGHVPMRWFGSVPAVLDEPLVFKLPEAYVGGGRIVDAAGRGLPSHQISVRYIAHVADGFRANIWSITTRSDTDGHWKLDCFPAEQWLGDVEFRVIEPTGTVVATLGVDAMGGADKLYSKGAEIVVP